MSSFAGSLTALFVAGMVGGYAGLCLLGPTDERQSVAVAAARIPDPPAVPCSMQAWPNADRKCLTWTAPRAEVAEAKTDGATTDGAKTDGASKVGAAAPAPGKRTTPAAQPSSVGMTVAARQAPAAVPQPAVEVTPDTAAAPEPQAEPAAPTKTPAAKSQARAKSKALAVVRGFGDNLHDVPLNAYASDGAPRRSAAPSAQYYNARPKGWWW
jgi:hypothetical protein